MFTMQRTGIALAAVLGMVILLLPASPGAAQSANDQSAGENTTASGLTFQISDTTMANSDGMTVVKDSWNASPDANHFGFAAQQGDKQAAVLDGVVGQAFDGSIGGSVHYSDDSQRVYYSIKQDNKYRLVVDGVAGNAYDEATCIFSPDSKRYAYLARQGKQYLLVTDGVEGKQFDVHFDEYGYPDPTFLILTFSPNSQRIAYPAEEGDKMMVNLDGVDGAKYDFVMSITFSPDSQRLAYLARQYGKEFVVLDGDEGKAYDEVSPNCITFSPDSKHLAYAARQGETWYVVADGVETPVDSEPFVYYAPYDNHLLYRVGEIDHEQTFLDGEKLPGGDDLSFVSYSPDGKRMAYAAKTGNKSVVMIDGVAGKEYDGAIDRPDFSPDSQRVAYQVMPEVLKNAFEVVDGVDGKLYDHVQRFTFSPDSQHFAYQARHGDKWSLVVDGNEAYDTDGFLSKIVFDSSTALHFVALSGGSKILRVTVKIGSVGG